MISLVGGTMWITPHDPPPGSAPSPYLQGGRRGGTLGDGCTMWTTTLAPPPGSAPQLKTSGKSHILALWILPFNAGNLKL